MAEDGLSAKQRRFVDEYLKDCNATQAAARAGYSPRSAHVTGTRVLANDRVAAAVRARQEKLSERSDMSKEEALGYMAQLVRTRSKRVPPSVKVAAVARMAAMCGWDAPTKFQLTADEAAHELARMLGIPVEQLPR
jgi:phage terminase small subunit